MLLRMVARLVSVPPSQRCFLDRFLGLLLAADEQDLPATTCDLLQKLGRAMQLLHGLIEINDINLVPLLKDERLHLGVPALGLVPKMDARFKKLGH